jgi:hypothetical protein
VKVDQPFLRDPFLIEDPDEDWRPKWWTPEGVERRAAILNAALQGCPAGAAAEVADLNAGEQVLAQPEQEIAQPAPVQRAEEQAANQHNHHKVYSPEMLLSDDDLVTLGDFAHAVQHAIKEWEKDKNTEELRSLGFRNVTEARSVISLIGRKGRSPWSAAYFKHNLPYIKPSTLVLLPPAHMLLHGLMKTFLKLSFGKLEPGWKTRDASEEKPFLFSRSTINAFKVGTCIFSMLPISSFSAPPAYMFAACGQ